MAEFNKLKVSGVLLQDQLAGMDRAILTASEPVTIKELSPEDLASLSPGDFVCCENMSECKPPETGAESVLLKRAVVEPKAENPGPGPHPLRQHG